MITLLIIVLLVAIAIGVYEFASQDEADEHEQTDNSRG